MDQVAAVAQRRSLDRQHLGHERTFQPRCQIPKGTVIRATTRASPTG
jgi:hypothetical protein